MRILICELVPPNILSTLNSVGQAGNNYCFNFIRASRVSMTYGLIPVQVLEKKTFINETNIKYIQVRFFKQTKLFRAINRLLESLLVLKNIMRHEPKSTTYWFYNITKHNFFLFFIIKILLSKPVYVILADFNPAKNKLSLDNLFLFLLKQANGIIALSYGVKRFNFKKVKIIAGVVANKEVLLNEKINKNTFLYAGSIRYHNGIELALSAFAKMPNKQLIITGHGDDEMVVAYAKKYENIKYLGFLSYEDYLQMLNKITFCLNLRTPHDAENDYNFPSKILEFFQHGQIVISTRRYESIPDKYLNYTEYNIDGLIYTINKIAKTPDAEINTTRKLAKAFVKNQFSYEALEQKINEIEANG